MSATAARTGLRDHLASLTGFVTYDHVPDSLDSTAINLVVEPAENYLSRADSFALGEVDVAVDVWVLAPYMGENETSAGKFDDALVSVLGALPREWVHTATSKPMTAASGEWTLYGCRLSLITTTTLT